MSKLLLFYKTQTVVFAAGDELDRQRVTAQRVHVWTKKEEYLSKINY
jgi:hypothetical protein